MAAGYPGQAPLRQTDSKAIVGLILAIGSWVICPVVLAIVGLILASQSNREIAASGGRLDGQGLNTATKVISWVNIGFTVLAVVAIIVIVVLALVFGLSVLPADIQEWTTSPTPFATGF